MTSTVPEIDTVVDDYLRRVRDALVDLPAAQSQEIVQELAEHIREAREDGAMATESDTRNILDRLGEPSDIAVEANRRFGQTSDAHLFERLAPGAREIGALVLLAVASYLVPIVGWAAGIIVVWTSTSWNGRDKLIATLLTPGAVIAVLLGEAVANAVGHSTGFPHAFFFLVLAAPLASAVYLLVRLDRRPRVQ